MGIFRFLSSKRVIQISNFLPKALERYVLRDKYYVLLSKQYLSAMKNPKSDVDKELIKKAYNDFKWVKKTSNLESVSKWEDNGQFKLTLEYYAKKFADEHITQHNFTSAELKSFILPSTEKSKPQNQSKHKSTFKENTLVNIKKTPTPKKDIPPKRKTREEIIVKEMYSVDNYKEDVDLYFKAVYEDMSENRERREKEWREKEKNAPSDFFKIYYQDLLRKVRLYKAQQRLSKQKHKSKDNDLEL